MWHVSLLQETDKKDMAGDVAAIDLAPVPEGRQRSRFLAVGSYDSTIRVLSLDPADTMKARALPHSHTSAALSLGRAGSLVLRPFYTRY